MDANDVAPDSKLLETVEDFYQMLRADYVHFINMLWPPDARGRRAPILMEILDDPRQEWMALEEIAKRSAAVAEGLLPPDTQTEAFDRNDDNAQQRLAELREQFAGEPRPGSIR